jgi:hypothetical protein
LSTIFVLLLRFAVGLYPSNQMYSSFDLLMTLILVQQIYLIKIFTIFFWGVNYDFLLTEL